MTYTLSFGIALGASRAGLGLSAQLVDPSGANVGVLITTGFVEIGGGSYLWTYGSFPDGLRGGVKFLSNGGATLETFAAVNPEEAERVDAKVTTRAATSDVPTATANANALFDQANAIDQGRTLRGALRLMLASMAGKLSGAATTTIHIRDTADSKDRMVATVDQNGNRQAVSYDDT